jgi:antitoxin component of RelBE/YafQ-DinJ toxin-antitoxin module
MKNEVIRFRVSESLKNEFQQLATNNSMSMSEYMVFLVRREIEKDKKSQKNKPLE